MHKEHGMLFQYKASSLYSRYIDPLIIVLCIGPTISSCLSFLVAQLPNLLNVSSIHITYGHININYRSIIIIILQYIVQSYLKYVGRGIRITYIIL